MSDEALQRARDIVYDLDHQDGVATGKREIKALAADVERLVGENDRLLKGCAAAQDSASYEVSIVNRVWQALGISTYEQADGKAIDEIVAAWKTRAASAEALVIQEREALIQERKKRYDLERQGQALTEELRTSQALVERLREAIRAFRDAPRPEGFWVPVSDDESRAYSALLDVLSLTPAQAGEYLRALERAVEAAKALADWADSPQMLDQQGSQIRQGLGYKAVADVRAALDAMKEQQ